MLWSEEIHLCPKCSTDLRRSGWRKRAVIAMDGVPETYWIRRLYCPKCKKIHHELPDFMIPYKRYTAQVIENILEGSTWDVPCDDNTIRLMRRWFFSIAENLLKLTGNHSSPLHEERTPFSSLQEIKKAYGNCKGWLCKAINHLVKIGYHVKTTRFLC